ncbi:MAG: response regulator [Candidatus Aminicenantes bacterium]|nr:response regulator [Candidatus Aminicenantes bacterium]
MLGKKILVVDDEESIRKTFVLLLNGKYRVVAAKDAEEALDKQKNGYDLVIADLRLPGKDGVELITELRRRGYRGEVILISAHAELVDPSILGRLRIGHFFAKPLDLNAISRSIDYLLTKDESAARI